MYRYRGVLPLLCVLCALGLWLVWSTESLGHERLKCFPLPRKDKREELKYDCHEIKHIHDIRRPTPRPKDKDDPSDRNDRNNVGDPNQSCGSDEVWDNGSRRCEKRTDYTSCGAGEEWVDGQCRAQADRCAQTGWKWQGNRCVAESTDCPAGTRREVTIGGSQCVPYETRNCPAGQSWSSAHNRCMDITEGRCPPGLKWDREDKRCVREDDDDDDDDDGPRTGIVPPPPVEKVLVPPPVEWDAQDVQGAPVITGRLVQRADRLLMTAQGGRAADTRYNLTWERPHTVFTHPDTGAQWFVARPVRRIAVGACPARMSAGSDCRRLRARYTLLAPSAVAGWPGAAAALGRAADRAARSALGIDLGRIPPGPAATAYCSTAEPPPPLQAANRTLADLLDGEEGAPGQWDGGLQMTLAALPADACAPDMPPAGHALTEADTLTAFPPEMQVTIWAGTVASGE